MDLVGFVVDRIVIVQMRFVEWGWNFDRIIVVFIHNYVGPDPCGFWGNFELGEIWFGVCFEYNVWVVDVIVEVVEIVVELVVLVIICVGVVHMCD